MRPGRALFLTSLILATGCAEQAPLQKTLTAAGITVKIEMVPGQLGRRACSRLMNSAADTLQQRLKLFLGKENEIERLNRERGPVEVSSSTYALLKLAEGLTHFTDGAWDARSGEVRKLWEFSENEPSSPDTVSLAKAVEKSQGTKIHLIEDDKVSLEGEGTFYLRRLAIGRSLDEAAGLMIEGGVAAGMLSADGIYRTWGRPDPVKEWFVIIQNPAKDSLQYRIDLIEGGLCHIGLRRVGVEGEYKNDFDLLDPRTGQPPEETIGIAAWATSSATAASFAEAMAVMGRVEALKWIAGCDTIAAFFITDEASGYRVESDPLMARRVNTYLP